MSALFFNADTIFDGGANSLSEGQPRWTVTAQYRTSANLAAELDRMAPRMLRAQVQMFDAANYQILNDTRCDPTCATPFCR